MSALVDFLVAVLASAGVTAAPVVLPDADCAGVVPAVRPVPGEPARPVEPCGERGAERPRVLPDSLPFRCVRPLPGDYADLGDAPSVERPDGEPEPCLGEVVPATLTR